MSNECGQFQIDPVAKAGGFLKQMMEEFTPLKTNMSPENQWLEDVFPTKIVHFFGTC